MFARLTDGWYLNLQHVLEVYREENGSARITSWQAMDGIDGEAELLEWYLTGAEEVAALFAALAANSAPRQGRAASAD